MSSPVLTEAATLRCSHGGIGRLLTVPSRVTVLGHAVLTRADRLQIAACPAPVPPAGPGPCTEVEFLTAATRVFSLGQPLLLADSQTRCLPSGTRALLEAMQDRVRAL